MKALDAIATAWTRNFELRHGLLPPIGKVTVDTAGKVAPYILGAVLGAGTVGSGIWALGQFIGSPEEAAPAAVEEAPQVEQSGSLYQYLEDRGDHLSP